MPQVGRVVTSPTGQMTLVGTKEPDPVGNWWTPPRQSSGSSSGDSGLSFATLLKELLANLPRYPEPPKLPAVVTIPDPDDHRIKQAKERELARRQRGRGSTIMSESNKLD